MAHVWIPLPDTDFDVTEVAVPWKLLTRAGHQVTFVTERGDVTPSADPLLITGVVFGQLGAEPEPKRFYEELTQSPEFKKPVSWKALDVATFDALLLPGVHAQGMKQYLGSEELQGKVRDFFALDRPVAAICHGVLVAGVWQIARDAVPPPAGDPRRRERLLHHPLSAPGRRWTVRARSRGAAPLAGEG